MNPALYHESPIIGRNQQQNCRADYQQGGTSTSVQRKAEGFELDIKISRRCSEGTDRGGSAMRSSPILQAATTRKEAINKPHPSFRMAEGGCCTAEERKKALLILFPRRFLQREHKSLFSPSHGSLLLQTSGSFPPRFSDKVEMRELNKTKPHSSACDGWAKKFRN